MNPIFRLFCALCFFIFYLNQAQSAPAIADESNFRLTIELRDGSRVVGKSPDDIWRFHSSSLGDMKLPLAGIRSIEFAGTNETARLAATNGDVFDVQFIAAVLHVETGFGKTELPVKLIKSIRVSAVGKPGEMPAGLVALWSGENNANDSVGENNGRLVGRVGFAPGKIGQAFDLNSALSGGDYDQGARFGGGGLGFSGYRPNRGGGYVQVPANRTLDVGRENGFTVAAWINPSSLNLQEVCEWNQNNGVPAGAPQIGAHMEINESSGDGSLWGNVVDTSGVSHCLHSENGIIIANSFQHIAMTYDQTSGMAALYRNGVVVAITNLGVFTPQTSFDFFMGNRPSGFFTGIYFHGQMDEVGIYNRALSDSEIQTIYETVPTKSPIVKSSEITPPAPAGKTNIQTTAAAADESGLRLAIELKDGSRIAGKSSDENLRFRSPSLGELKLSLAALRSIEFTGDTDQARLSLTNGDVIDVRFIATSLRVETSFGKNELPVKLIRSVKISALGHFGRLPSGLVALWSGDGNADDSNGGNSGTLMNGVGFAEAVVGQGFRFSGANQCVVIPHSTSLITSNFSVEAWVKPMSQITDSADDQAVIFGQSYGRCQMDVRRGTSGLFATWVFGTSRSTFYDVVSTVEIPIGQFSYLVGTWDGTALRLYVNGVLSAQRTVMATPVDSGCPFYIGGFYSPAPDDCQSVSQFFNGIIDEAGYFNRALSDSEIQAVYAAQK